MADIALRNVTKKFKENRALDDVCLEVKNKEFFVIFGPAGAGKTTVLNMIAGIHTPDQGQVEISNQVMNIVEPEDRNIAMVFENYALYPHLTVFENMASPLRSPKYRQPEAKIREEVNRVAGVLKIDWLLERKPSELSNGQRQRVALGRALVRNPVVFLMDEPLTHLDAKLRHQMRAELKEMQKNLDTTTIYVTHDYLEALSLGDRIAVLNQGRIEQVGTPEEIYFQPASEFVAEAFGEPEINIVEAEIIRENGQVTLDIYGSDQHFVVPEDVAAILKSYSSVRAGFRPKDIGYSLTQHEEGTIPAKAYSFEPLGARAILTVQIGENLLRLVAPPELQVTIDQAVYLKFDTHKAIFFDVRSRRFLARSREARRNAAWPNS